VLGQAAPLQYTSWLALMDLFGTSTGRLVDLAHARHRPLAMGPGPSGNKEDGGVDETATLLVEVHGFFKRYVVLPAPYFYDAVALWVLHAHAIEAAETTPRLVFKSPEKESGKTRGLEVLELLTPNPLSIINTTIAAVFRLLATEPTTVLFDEIDAIFGARAAREHEDLRALLNAGYRRGATVARVVGEGKKMEVQRFPVFAATAMAAIGNLPDTIESRAIIIPMRRRAPDEDIQPFRHRTAKPAGTALRERLARWAAEYHDQLAVSEPELPDGITDRAADIWEPLVAIADLAGIDWPARARAAAGAIVAGRVADDQSLGVRLLADINTIFDGHDRMPSATMAKALSALEEQPWGGFHGGAGIDQRGLAKYLRPFGIEPKVIKLADGSTPRGYLREMFTDAWVRYPRYGSATTETSATAIRIQVAEVADVVDVDRPGPTEEICPGCRNPEADAELLPGDRWRCAECRTIWPQGVPG
jgi:hypothetical protein